MQNMPWLESAALSILVPAGSQRDPLEKAGLAGFTAEMVQRGCGPYNSRHFVEQLDRLGAARSASVTNYHTRFSAAIPTTRLRDTLELYRELILNPHLPPEQLEDSRMVAMQELLAMEDDLAQKLMREMRKRLYPDPYGRSTTGCMESVQSIELADVQRHVQQYYVPDRAIISIAGKIDFNEVLAYGDDKNLELGEPTISGAKVEADLLENGKNRTVLIFKKRRRQNSRRKNGHRQQFSLIRINKIFAKDGKIISEAEKIKKASKKVNVEKKEVSK